MSPSFKEGDEVVLWPLDEWDAQLALPKILQPGGIHGASHALGWTPRHEKVARAATILKVRNKVANGLGDFYYELQDPGDQELYWAHAEWLVKQSLGSNATQTFTCVCDITMGGCICGAMEAEMKAQNKFKNPHTGLWEKKDDFKKWWER